MCSFGCGTLGVFLGPTCLFFGLPLSLLLRTAGLLFRLTLGHFLRPLGCLLLGAHLLLSGLALSLLLSTLHFGLLLAACGFFSLTLGHLLRTLCGFLLGTCLLLSTLHFSLLLKTCGLFSLSLRHLLGTALCFLLGTHLLLFSGTACDFLLLALHGSGFSLLPDAFGFRSSGLFGGHAFSGGTLLLGRQLLLLLHGGSFGLLACFFSLDGSLVSSHALLLGGNLLFLLHRGSFGLLAYLFSLGGSLVSGHALLLGRQLLLLLHDGSFGLLACFFSLGGSLVSGHALLLGGESLLLLSSGGCLHAVFFRFGIRSGLFSGPFSCHATFLHPLLLALLHGGGTGLFPGSVHLSSFSFGGCSGGRLIGCHFLHCHWLL